MQGKKVGCLRHLDAGKPDKATACAFFRCKNSIASAYRPAKPLHPVNSPAKPPAPIKKGPPDMRTGQKLDGGVEFLTRSGLFRSPEPSGHSPK